MDSSLLLTDMHGEHGTKTMNIDILKGSIPADKNGLCTNSENRGMLERKDFEQVDSVFQIVAAFVDRALDQQHRPPHYAPSFHLLRASESAKL